MIIKIIRLTENREQLHEEMGKEIQLYMDKGYKREGRIYITGGQMSAIEYFQVMVKDEHNRND